MEIAHFCFYKSFLRLNFSLDDIFALWQTLQTLSSSCHTFESFCHFFFQKRQIWESRNCSLCTKVFSHWHLLFEKRETAVIEIDDYDNDDHDIGDRDKDTKFFRALIFDKRCLLQRAAVTLSIEDIVDHGNDWLQKVVLVIAHVTFTKNDRMDPNYKL